MQPLGPLKTLSKGVHLVPGGVHGGSHAPQRIPPPGRIDAPGQGQDIPAVHQAGGNILVDLLHPSWTIHERLYRALPEDGWFDPSVSRSSLVQFELGSFHVPDQQDYWLFDYEFKVLRFSGIDPGDFLPAEDGRFSGVLGFDLTFNGRRLADLLYELQPVPPSINKQSVATVGRARPADFTRSAAHGFAGSAGAGTSLLPVRSQTMGPRARPFTLIAEGGTQVSLVCVIFKPVPVPIACVQGGDSGYLINASVSRELLRRLMPR